MFVTDVLNKCSLFCVCVYVILISVVFVDIFNDMWYHTIIHLALLCYGIFDI